MNRIRWYGPAVVLLLTVLLVMVLGPGITRQLTYAHEAAKVQLVKDSLDHDSALAQLSNAFKEVAQAVEPSVVYIQVYKKPSAHPQSGMSDDLLRRFFGPNMVPPGVQPPDQNQQPQSTPNDDRYAVPQIYGSGSGWVYDTQGHIITNYHVIKDADKVVVRFHDGTERTAKVQGVDPRTDIAVLQVDGVKAVPATIATQPVAQGEIVFDFGSPFRFEFSMSQGIVSAKGRRLGITDVKVQNGQLVQEGYENFIQTDAAINPGNSGGPLTNIYGQVVGMNSAIATRTGAFNGLGFAIPVDMVKHIADQLITKGKISRGYLGVYIRDLDEKMARTFGFSGKGVLVDPGTIPGGPAEAAGLKRGDIITKVGGKAVTSADQLRNMVANIAPGTKTTLEVFRNGKTLSLPLTVAELPSESATAAVDTEPNAPTNKNRQVLNDLGFDSVMDMTPDIAARYRIKMVPGVLVLDVRDDSAAAAEGITRGAIITDVMGTKVATVDQLATALSKYNLTRGVRISVVENGQERFAVLQLPQN